MSEGRIGLGTDIHRIVAERPLVLGGVLIQDHHGLDGHSDADALTHAIIDALLGAAALGDIGTHFPSHDTRWKDADSLDLLRRAVASLHERGYRVGNIDATVDAEDPKLQPHIEAMRASLAEAIGIDVDAVSVKAKSADGLGAIGQREGIAAVAIARVVSQE